MRYKLDPLSSNGISAQTNAGQVVNIQSQGVPHGGSTGQILKKTSGYDFDTEWANEGGGSSAWGGITGTLSDQTDLQGAIDAKADTTSLATVATTGAYSDLSGTPTIPTSVDDLSPSQTGNAGKYLTTDGTNASWASVVGGGGAVDVVSNVATSTILGRVTAGSGDSEELTAAQVRTLINVEDGATADQTANEILAAIKTVDGATSGLDADLLDGNEATAFATSAQGALADSAVQPGDLATVATTGSYSDLSSTPTLGTAAAKNIPATGDASATEVVYGTDTRLTDSRTPTSHTHPASELTATGISGTKYLRGDNTWATPTNTTYSEISEAEITTGTASTLRTISGRRAGFLKNTDNHVSGTTNKVYTATEQSKLAGIADGATANTGTVTSVAATVPTGMTVSGSPITTSGTLALGYDTGYQGYTTTEASKLSGIATGATANDTDANLKNTDNHTSGTTNKVFTATEQSKLSGIEASADVTDATNVAAAGAVMDGDFSSNGLMKRTAAGTYSVAAAPTGDVVGTSDSQTLTNKTLTTPTIAQVNSSTGVKLQLDTQTDNSNSISSAQTAGVRMQMGWGQFEGTGATSVTETITYPTAFTTVMGVMVSVGAGLAGVGAAGDITGLVTEFGTTQGLTAQWSDVTTTTFKATIGRSTGTFGAGTYFGYSWIAWGV